MHRRQAPTIVDFSLDGRTSLATRLTMYAKHCPQYVTISCIVRHTFPLGIYSVSKCLHSLHLSQCRVSTLA